MRVAIISTDPPRPCGIGTFTADLRSALLGADPRTQVDVIELAREQHHEHALEVVATIRQDVHSDYSTMPQTLTSRGTDVVLVEHEYGIFGGVAGSFITSLAEGVTQPLVVTLHTVLSEPSARQADALRALCHHALPMLPASPRRRISARSSFSPRATGSRCLRRPRQPNPPVISAKHWPSTRTSRAKRWPRFSTRNPKVKRCATFSASQPASTRWSSESRKFSVK